MSATDAQDEATKQRIISHMQRDHHDSIRRYLESYCSKSQIQTRHARMTGIDLNRMTFDCGAEKLSVPFDPPMKSLREARERVVQMDKDALQVLGRSDIQITTFVPCYTRPGHLFNFTQCMLAYALLPRPANWQPGSLLYDHVLFSVPAFATFVSQICLLVFAIMIPIHVTEAVIMARKLSRHGLTPFDSLWWKWTGTCFVEGFTSFWRLNGHIEEKRREKEAKKH